MFLLARLGIVSPAKDVQFPPICHGPCLGRGRNHYADARPIQHGFRGCSDLPAL